MLSSWSVVVGGFLGTLVSGNGLGGRYCGTRVVEGSVSVSWMVACWLMVEATLT